MLLRLLGLVFAIFVATQSSAQSARWLQIEAHPTLSAAQDAARTFAAELDDVAGFHLGSNWYGVALGPYSEQDAERLLRQLRQSGQIPRDSFVSDGQRYGQQFWPIGVGIGTDPKPLPNAPTAEPEPEQPAVAETVIEPTPPDETPAEARASESALTREEKMDLQIALQWAGFYNAAIDASFGRGTRNSMAAWQQANGYYATGILTTAQRADLIGQYNAILNGTDLTLVEDTETGVAMQIPLGLVEFDSYHSPFAHYVAKDGSGVQVLIISQPGNRTRLHGLYEILQTLEIMPLEGERTRRNDSFDIEGVNDSIHSYATARLIGDEIKGFIVVWPTGDDERRSRVLAEMTNSFAPIDGVLSLASVPAEAEEAIDMVSGLSIRTPKTIRSGFYVDANGTTVTAAANVDQCERVTLAGDFAAEIAYQDDAIAVLKPVAPVAPLGTVTLNSNGASLSSAVAAGGFPYGGALVLPTLTFGSVNSLTALDGDDTKLRLEMNVLDGDIGGPVFDNSGAVVGVIIPMPQTGDQMLPPNVTYAASVDTVKAAVNNAGSAVDETSASGHMAPATLSAMAADVMVLVNCW